MLWVLAVVLALQAIMSLAASMGRFLAGDPKGGFVLFTYAVLSALLSRWLWRYAKRRFDRLYAEDDPAKKNP